MSVLGRLTLLAALAAYFLVVIETREESDASAGITNCKGRVEQIGSIWDSFRQAGMKCRLELGHGADECNLYVRVQSDVAFGDEFCFVPENFLFQPYVVSPSEPESSRLLAASLQTAFTKHGVCDSRTALAVRLIHEGQRRCDCSSQQDLYQNSAKCSMWACLLPGSFSNALEFNTISRQLLNGTSARGSLGGLKFQHERVLSCLDKIDGFPRAPTEQEIAWGFHAARTRGSGRDKDNSLINPITVMFNYHPNMSKAQMFAWSDNGPVRTGEVMRAKFDLKLGDEIFYNYGDFTNAELLVLYGFVIPESVAREVDMPATRIYADGLKTLENQRDAKEHKEWHAYVKKTFKALKCDDYVLLAFGHDGQLRLEHSRLFPPCAALHFLSTIGPTPENPEPQQIVSSQGKSSLRIRDWPPTLDERDARVWHDLVAHQWTLLAEICGKEMQRLEDAVAATGMNLDVTRGTLELQSQVPWEEDQQTKDGVIQILNIEVSVYARCKNHSLEVAATPLKNLQLAAKRAEL